VKHKKETAGQPETSTKALEWVVRESQAISCVQIGTVRDSSEGNRGNVYKIDSLSAKREEKYPPESLPVPVDTKNIGEFMGPETS
jgi:hypothetical protein